MLRTSTHVFIVIMVTPTSFLRKSGPVKTGPTWPAPTPKWYSWSKAYAYNYLTSIQPIDSTCIIAWEHTASYPYLFEQATHLNAHHHALLRYCAYAETPTPNLTTNNYQ